jgi:hypothetical protein
MKKKISDGMLPLVVLGALSISGCETSVDAYTTDALTTTDASFEYGGLQLPIPFNLDGGKNGVLPGGITFADAKTNDKKRNDVAYLLIERSNALCRSHRAKIAAISSGTNFGLTELATALNTAGALVTGKEAANILTGIAGATNATRGAFNEHFYQDQLMPAILESIKNSRNNKYTEIVGKFTKTIDEYPASAMIVDVNDYHMRCDFLEGVAALAAAAKKVKVTDKERQQEVEDLTKQLKGLQDARKSTTTTAQRDDVDAAGKEITARIEQLKREQSVKPNEAE